MEFEDIELEDISKNSDDKTKLLQNNEEDNSLVVSCYIVIFTLIICLCGFFIKSILDFIHYNDKK